MAASAGLAIAASRVVSLATQKNVRLEIAAQRFRQRAGLQPVEFRRPFAQILVVEIGRRVVACGRDEGVQRQPRLRHQFGDLGHGIGAVDRMQQ